MTIDPDHQAILEGVERFCRDLDPAELLRRDEHHIAPYDYLPQLGQLGLIAAALPEEHGGLGLPWSVFCRIQETIGYHAQPIGSILNRIISFGAMPLINFGAPEQQARFLPGLLAGETLHALALNEPTAGSDARAASTKAVPVAGGWKISGRKTWISDAQRADRLLTLCRVPTDDGKKSFVALLIPTTAQGVSMTPLPKVGNNCMPSFDIGFDEVFVADEDRLGEVGKGFETITGSLKYSRASLSALILGAARAALDLAVAHAGERVQFKQPIVANQVIRHRLVDMNIELQKARFLVYELARAVDADEPAEALGAMAKTVASEMFQYITDKGMQILASAGYAVESPMQMHWRNARLYSFGEGANEIQREIVARHMGLVTR